VDCDTLFDIYILGSCSGWPVGLLLESSNLARAWMGRLGKDLHSVFVSCLCLDGGRRKNDIRLVNAYGWGGLRDQRGLAVCMSGRG